MKNEDLDNLFRNELSNREVEPSADLWQKIEAQLDEQKPKRRILIYTWIKSAAAIAIIAGAATFLYMHQNAEVASPALQVAETTQAPQARNRDVLAAPQQEAAPTKSPSREAEKERTHPAESTMQLVGIREAEDKKASLLEDTHMAKGDEHTALAQPKRQLASIAMAQESELNITATAPSTEIPRYRVVEIDPIKPLIENPEDEEALWALTPQIDENIVPNLLNRVKNLLYKSDDNAIHFSRDEEGTLQLDFGRSLAKNRTKKRK